MVLRKFAVPLTYLALTWVSLALIGYGLALRKFGMEQRREEVARSDLREGPEGEIESRQGRVTASSSGWSKSLGMHFTLEGSDDSLFIPEELISDHEKWKLLAQYLKPGTKVRARFRKKGLIVLDLQSNPDTVFQKSLLSVGESLGQLARVPANALRRAKVLLLLGVFPVPLGVVFQFARRRFMKTVRKAWTTGKV